MSDNPFLLPPGGAKPADPKPSDPPIVTPDPASPAHPTHYIAVPASVESATHRIARPKPEPETEPGPAPAQPAPGTEPAPAPTDTVAEETRLVATAEHLAEETRLAPALAQRTWVLTLPDGARLPLTGPLLLGRDPAAIPSHPAAQLLALTDPGKTVSKTHALLEPAAVGVRVRELHSTNGVAVDGPGGRQVAAAGGELIAPAGSNILLGSFPIGVVAAAGGATEPAA